MEAAVLVDGMGAVAVPVPPDAVVYQSRFVPVAVNALAVAFSQYTTGVVITGITGAGSIVTVVAVLGLSQPLTV